MSSPSPSADRNLIFGLLALQMDFLTSEQMLDALHAWMRRKTTPIGEILRERGLLNERRLALLQGMVEEHIAQHGGDPQASLAAMAVGTPVREDLGRIEDADVQASVAWVVITTDTRNRAALDSAASPPTAAPVASAPAGVRYRRLRTHARGGLGEVFVAVESELNREVALKEIQDRFADHPDARARFVREAEVTGKLEHPGVVPVYGLGVYPDGRPYYAMRFIRGESMQEAIRRFHAPKAQGLQPLGFDSLDFRELLGRFVAVCYAVAYAHARGIIHRDLKPANVMLGEYGETLVVDWGLARMMDQPAGEQTTAERPVELGSGSATAPTQMGQVVGTPAYMPPEQAEGRLDRVGVGSDVFALGATLYCLLTGQPPFGGEDVLAQARRGEVVPARQRKASVPAALEAVCQKAMAKQPEDRYPKARALAEELQRWLAGEPVSAWPEPLVVKVGRWVRRNRVLASATAAATVVALVLVTAGGVYRQQQRARAVEQAESGLTQAAAMRDRYRYADADAMLKQALGWARQAANSDLSARVEQAQADLDLAHDLDDVRQKAATLVEGKWIPWRVRVEYADVLARHGLDVLSGDANELAEQIRVSAVRMAIVASLDDWAKAESDRAKVQRLLELANRADEPDVWRHAVRAAVAHRDVKSLHRLAREPETGTLTPGVVFLLHTVSGNTSAAVTALLRRLQREQPDDFWISLALGGRLREQNQIPEAAECYLVTVALRPDSAVAHYNLGIALKDKGRVDDAIACYRRAIRLDPKNARAHTNLGVALKDKGQVDDAIACHREAIRLDPTLAKAHSNLGVALKDKGQVDDAIACFRQAIRHDPILAAAQYNLGVALAAKRQMDDAIVCYREAIRLDPMYAVAHFNLGIALAGKGQVDDAIASYRKAIQINPRHAQAHTNLGVALAAKGRMDDAIACFRQAIQLDPKDAGAHNNLGSAFTAKGRVDDAIACYRQGIQLNPNSAGAHTGLGIALKAKGQVDDGIACYRRAIRLDPKYAQAHGALGKALLDQGKFIEARTFLRRCIDLLPPNHSLRAYCLNLLQQCGQLLAAEDSLKAFLAGKGAPADTSRQVQMAALAQKRYKRLYLTAARLYRDAFAYQPSLAGAHCYNAACAAALAGAGQGKDAGALDERHRAAWRQQALDWLAADLDRHATLAKKAEGRPVVRQKLTHWLKDADLAGVRDEAALPRLPEKEREPWRKLWADVAALLKKVEQK